MSVCDMQNEGLKKKEYIELHEQMKHMTEQNEFHARFSDIVPLESTHFLMVVNF